MEEQQETRQEPEEEGSRAPEENTVAKVFDTSQDRRVLSIQSHVVSGYVGNKSATFPLQLLGFDVDPINSVHFSNHTGYAGGFTGQVLTGEQLWKIYEGLEKNGLVSKFTHLLTGYVGAEDFLQTVVRVVKAVRAANPTRFIPYYCDPVLGDNGKCYVPASLIDIYKTEVMRIATVIAPNQFECELLTGIKIKSLHDVRTTFTHFHGLGIKTVVITSLAGLTKKPFNNPSKIYMVASTLTGNPHDERPSSPTQCFIDVPRIPAYFTGTGDLTASLLLAWFHRSGSIATAMENACATIQAVLQRTWRHSKKPGNERMAEKELRLIQSAADILQPPVKIKCRVFDDTSGTEEGIS